MFKGFLKSKTINFGHFLIVAGLLEHNSDFISQLFPAEYSGLGLALIGVTVQALRLVTTKAIAEK